MKLDIEDILHDQNDINESTRAQLDAISTALTKLQSKEPRKRRPIGFIVLTRRRVETLSCSILFKVEIERFPPFSFVFHFFFEILQDYYGEEATNRRRLLLQRK